MPDANTGGDSSTTPDANEQESSTAEQGAQEAGAEVAEATAATEETESPAEATAEEAGEETTAEVAEENTAEAGKDKKAEEAPVHTDKPEDAKLEFHKHPRFQELVQEKTRFKQEAEALKPEAEANRVLKSYMQSNGIVPQELQNALEYLRLRRQDPAKAFQVVKQDYDALALYTGERLTPELEAEVAAGTLSVERAKQIVRAEAAQQHQQWQGKLTAEQQQQQAVQAIQGSVDSWAQSKMQSDPDFRPRNKADANAVDGKWEFVDMKLRTMRQEQPPKTPQEAVAQVEKAYAEANKFFSSFVKPTAVKKALRSQTSTQNSSAVVKSADDVVRAVLAGKKPHQLRYS